MNYVVGGTTPMDEIPDHSITPPFGNNKQSNIEANERFNRYRSYIVPWFRDIMKLRMGMVGVYECPVCCSVISSSKSCRVLSHLASKKHLRAALGDELQECDKRDGRRVGSKHIDDNTTAPIHSVVGDVTSGLGE
jgi:hypothetical protein